MLIIRREQIEILSQYMYKQFEDRMLIHLKKFFPDKYEALEKTKIKKLIRKGIKQASEYEIITERDVCKFIDLMFVLGKNFDKNSKISWANEILCDKSLKSPSKRIKTLCDKAIKYQRARNVQ